MLSCEMHTAWVGRAARALLVCALLFGPVWATEDDAEQTEDPAFPPGQEELLSEILGKGLTLPGHCEFVGGQADHTTLEATYACSAGEVVIELAHPGKAAETATHTARFAVRQLSGSPPPGFVDALVSRIMSREADFEWTDPAAAADTVKDDGGALN